MKTTLLLLFAAIALHLPERPLHAADNAPDLMGVEWLLQQINGKPVKPSGKKGLPTLLLSADKLGRENKQASGFAGVNRFSGGYKIEGGTLKFSQMASTLMGGPPEQMATEGDYLKALEGITNWRIEKGSLELMTGANVVLRFSARE